MASVILVFLSRTRLHETQKLPAGGGRGSAELGAVRMQL
jgi:hypothetical protein